MGKHGKYRPLVRIAALLLALWPVAAQANCRQALAIGLDISGSVDTREYRLQMDGLAGALLNPDVRAAFLASPGAPVRLFIFEWAGIGTQRPLIGWTVIASQADLNAIAGTLRTTARQPREVATAVGQAMLFGARELASQNDCWRQTLDLSGDGQSNIGPRPQDIRSTLADNITINAIVIGTDGGMSQGVIDGEITLLTSYFRAQVIAGPHAFVEAAIGFEDFQDAMARKLLKELETLAIGALHLPAHLPDQ